MVHQILSINCKMCLKIVFIALTVTVDSRPQYGNFFQASGQQYFVPLNPESVYGERTFVSDFIQVQPNDASLNNQFMNTNSRGVKNRHSDVTTVNEQYIPNSQHTMNQNNNNNERHLMNGAARTNVNHQQNIMGDLEDYQFVKTNVTGNNQPYERIVQESSNNNTIRDTEIRANKNFKTQQNLRINSTNVNTKTRNAIPNNRQTEENNNNIVNNEFNQSVMPNTEENNQILNTTTKLDNSNRTVYRSNVNNTDRHIATVNTSDIAYNGKSSNSNNSKPDSANSYADPPVLKPPKESDGPEKRTGDDKDDDRWVWMDETTPSVIDRASFDGGMCPTGKAKVGGMCVNKD